MNGFHHWSDCEYELLPNRSLIEGRDRRFMDESFIFDSISFISDFHQSWNEDLKKSMKHPVRCYRLFQEYMNLLRGAFTAFSLIL
ncbi:hypothetical protein T07_7109 [Trichinella nelsoni]|uniref:Uncharacterized protein n=1 Tax=Trichinella nelsoni TaxID=6336 RepID=A0A0V0SCW9_9BILA|nr:hypothetical protein T07_7109 [Trichinella nelsoni]